MTLIKDYLHLKVTLVFLKLVYRAGRVLSGAVCQQDKLEVEETKHKETKSREYIVILSILQYCVIITLYRVPSVYTVATYWHSYQPPTTGFITMGGWRDFV